MPKCKHFCDTVSEAKLQVKEREAWTLNWLLDMDTIQAPVGSAVSNNFHVKQPVRYPYLSFEESHYVKPHPVTEGHSRVHT